ncbi:2OG-Fe(II)oxygenase superfamily protein [Colletotrichum higginsianum IMI 349063]|uniref:2OG-Fe(II)oxygenase superfamily protein n=1 Tax=Colletotrichum higginsianum (strain IMI 349063) TaxID=759273 RepID=A0A1B7YIQ6_COLHI|nr:2OG-Fe(II)oxygenase superfamily protein [Colletotrichum higginsianum IMI 349063]OBR11862.1 2OG-Fe(II)oxygenase superfamily protein [Colletotrichum higginsianum IMI 349063]
MAPKANIPIIDIASPDVDRANVARQLVDAAAEHGFIYIRSTGKYVALGDIDTAFSLVLLFFELPSKKLFKSPVEEKAACTIQKNNRGWSGMHSETLDPKNQKAGYRLAFNFGEFRDGKAQQPLPQTIQPDEPFVNSFSDQCHALCLELLELLGIGLEVYTPHIPLSRGKPLTRIQVDPPTFFSSAHLRSRGESGTILRMLYYPPTSSTAASPDDIRAGAHSDYGSLTLLFRLRGQAGLEILTRDNAWAPVPVTPPGTESDASPPILVNIGDLLSYWTNGLFRSTVHRVVFGGEVAEGETDTGPRYSMAFFCHPVGSVALDPVPSERVKGFVAPEGTPNANPYAERKVLTADEHLFMRLRESYKGLYKDETKA